MFGSNSRKTSCGLVESVLGTTTVPLRPTTGSWRNYRHSPGGVSIPRSSQRLAKLRPRADWTGPAQVSVLYRCFFLFFSYFFFFSVLYLLLSFLFIYYFKFYSTGHETLVLNLFRSLMFCYLYALCFLFILLI